MRWPILRQDGTETTCSAAPANLTMLSPLSTAFVAVGHFETLMQESQQETSNLEWSPAKSDGKYHRRAGMYQRPLACTLGFGGGFSKYQ